MSKTVPSSKLKNILTFSNVAAGGSSTLAHGLTRNGVSVIPDTVFLDTAGFTVTTTSTNVTVTNNTAAAATCRALVEYWHSAERAMTTDPLLASSFAVTTGGAGVPDPYTPPDGTWNLVGNLSETYDTSVTYGPELVTNGNFATDLSGWAGDANWTWVAGKASHAPGSAGALTQSINQTTLTLHQVEFVLTVAAGTLTVDIGGANVVNYGTWTAFDWGDTYKRSVWITGATGPATLSLTPSNDFNGTITSITIKTLTAMPSAFTISDPGSPNPWLETRGDYTLGNVFSGGAGPGQLNSTGGGNTGFGYNVAYYAATGMYNSYFGALAGHTNFNGSYDTFIGNSTGLNCENGYADTFVGTNAGRATTNGSYGVLVGAYAGYAQTTGNYNTGVGYGALRAVVTSSNNTAVGYQAGRYVTGADNTTVGYQAGRTVTTGGTNTFVGSSAGYNASQKVDAVNSTAIGANAYTTASNQVVLGDANVLNTILRGNILVSTVAAGATAAGVLALGNSATAPTNSADMAQLYSADTAGAGTTALAIYQEAAPSASVGTASTHKVPVTINGTLYYMLLTNV